MRVVIPSAARDLLHCPGKQVPRYAGDDSEVASWPASRLDAGIGGERLGTMAMRDADAAAATTLALYGGMADA